MNHPSPTSLPTVALRLAVHLVLMAGGGLAGMVFAYLATGPTLYVPAGGLLGFIAMMFILADHAE